MKVLVGGATGALGTQLVAQLVARGHEVFGMTRDKLAHLGPVSDMRALLARRRR